MVMPSTALETIDTVMRTSKSEHRVELRKVPPAPSLQRRLGTVSAREDFDQSRSLSHEVGIPFWHSVFRLGSQAEDGVPREILDAAMYRQSTEHYAYINCGESFFARATEVIEAAPTDAYVVASSSVETSKGTMHLPMLDFSVKERWVGALKTAEGSIRALGLPGTLLASGRSFHFIADELTTWENYSAFLQRALLLTPIVDERWVAHQLLAGRATLRVSPNKHGQVPRVVAHIS